MLEGTLAKGAFGAVMTNPPYVKLDNLHPSDRKTYEQYLGERYSGRIDAYIPFVQLCLELSAPGGLICLVLPQAFLSAVNAAMLRRKISEQFDVRCLVEYNAGSGFRRCRGLHNSSYSPTTFDDCRCRQTNRSNRPGDGISRRSTSGLSRRENRGERLLHCVFRSAIVFSLKDLDFGQPCPVAG